jgi:hypothetical protein
MQTVPDSDVGAVDAQRVNDLVKQAVEKMNADGKTNVRLLDTNSAWNAACIAKDGMHLTNMGLDAWYRYICAHATF